jgi:hypothetical protein
VIHILLSNQLKDAITMMKKMHGSIMQELIRARRYSDDGDEQKALEYFQKSEYIQSACIA